MKVLNILVVSQYKMFVSEEKNTQVDHNSNFHDTLPIAQLNTLISILLFDENAGLERL